MSEQKQPEPWEMTLDEYITVNWAASKEFGECPLLIAEHAELKAKWAIVEAAEYIAGMTKERICASRKFDEYVDLVVNLVFAVKKSQSEKGVWPCLTQ